MKVLLLFKPNIPIIHTQQNVTPNGLLYMGALLLSKGIDCEVLNLSKNTWEECEDLIKEKKPDVVGITCFTFNRQSCIKLAKTIKEINEKTKVVFGGPHPSMMFDQLFQISKDLDIIVLNEGELTFLEIVNRLQNKESLENLEGIVYRNNNKIVNNGLRKPLVKLDELPIPATYFKYKRLITSRGCPAACIYCDTPQLWGQRVRFRTPENVVDELEMLHKKHGISFFIMSDDTFTFIKKRTIEICKEIIKRNLKITWDCRSRVNFVCEERLRWMKKAGCVTISYGIESGSQKMLNTMKKGTRIEQIKKAAELTRSFGYNLNFFIIVGAPGETDDTIRETMKLIEETRPTSIFAYVMQLTPGTEIYKMAKSNDFVKDADWITKDSETIFYDREKTMDELTRYVTLINELFRLLQGKVQYSKEEILKSMANEKGVQDLVNLAHVHMRTNELEKAETVIDEALQFNSGSTEAMAIKAILLAKKGDESCKKYFNKAIKGDPENLLAYKNLAFFLYKQKKHDEAIKVFEKAIEIEPANPDFYNNLGSIYGAEEKYDQAIKIFEKALAVDPKNKGTINNLRLTFEKQGDLKRLTEFNAQLVS